MGETPNNQTIYDGGLVLTAKGFSFREGVDNQGDGNIADRRFVTLPDGKHYWVVCDYTGTLNQATLSFIEAQKKDQIFHPGKGGVSELQVILDTASFGKDEATILSSFEEIRTSYMDLIRIGKSPGEILTHFAKPPVVVK